MNRLVAALFVAAFGLSTQAAAASDFVVLESNVASYAPGSVIPGNQNVQLAGGARLVMIASDGSTRSVAGPYAGAIADAGADAPGALDRLVASREEKNHVVGAIRAPSWDQ
ncbi:MAG: hypothetical protein CML46_17710 [Rhodobacteraceae bacterium]|nr:hypothetical protein [Paracoccaceae bacterium]MBR28753.1 hypothetical protein [Paracoccaceae bacterium]|tara:strand:- start:576 stop:908 length:333 start_codon:yes stop_codon:yes gene_type:complete